MKIRSTILALSVAFGLCSHAQYWDRLNSGVTSNLEDVFFISPSQGWAVGDLGVILTTTDGGDTWTQQVSNVTIDLNAVFFTSATKGWAVGPSTLLTTENGGATWTSVPITPLVSYNDMIFTSPDTGYIVGGSGVTGVVNRTFNGGLTWTSTTVDRILYAVDFTSNTHGWAVGYVGVIYRTTNGVTWTQQVAPGANNLASLNAIDMISDMEGWATGNPSSNKRTLDGGVTWTNHSSGTNAGKTDIYFSDSQNGWMSTTVPLGWEPCPSGCPMWYTTNGGSNWVVDTLQAAHIREMMFYDPSLGWAVGLDGWILRHGNPSGTSVAEEEMTSNTIRISPNPVADLLTLTGEERIISTEVFDALGELVLSANDGGAVLDVSTLPPGSYAIRMTTGANRAQQVERFIKD